ncbi:MAG: MATE family efflux transporter [Clostridia bacterium]|nr:MATE family efflux transporter [Clostridia bacterium]
MQAKTRLLTRDKSFYKSLFLLSLPIALQNLITFAVGLADNVMISPLGDAAVSGVYMANQIQTLLQLVSGGVESSILVLAAQYLGRGDTESMRRISAIGVRIGSLFGALTTIVCTLFPTFILSLFTNKADIIDTGAPYLFILAFSFIPFTITQSLIASARSAENARIGLYVSLASLISNITLNYILIYGKLGLPAMGIKGAALATLISRLIECLIIVIYTFLIEKKLKLRPRYLIRFDKKLFLDFVRYGAPLLLGQIVWASNMLIGSGIMGRQSEDGIVAALSMANTMHNLAYVAMNGMANAVGIITGKTVGSGDTEKMKEYARTTQIIFASLGLITGLGVQLLKAPFISLYQVSPNAIAQAHLLINVISVTIVGSCYQVACLFGLVKSGGDTGFVFRMDLIFVFLVVLPAGMIASALGAPGWVVFACLKCDQILKCFVAFFKIRSYNWMKNLTRAGDAS